MSSLDESINREVDIPFQMLHEKIIKVLTQSIYPSPNISVIRELVRNGVDSIKTKGLRDGDGQITVTIDANDCVIAVEDNGTGLSANDIRQVYCSIGETTKSHDSSLGIGSKSPLLMADAYLVQTWAEGSQPVAFTATSKGIKFLESSTLAPIPHHGTKVLVPFDPSKLDINKLTNEAKRVFEFVQTPIYLDTNGQKELISTRSFESIDLADHSIWGHDRQPRNKTTTSLLGATLKLDNSDWTTILLLKQDGNLRGPYESTHDICFHLFVDGLPLKCSKSLTERTELFPASAEVVVNIKNRNLIDVAADRESLIENHKTLATLTTIQKATEEPAVASILALPKSPYELLTWNRDREDEEQKYKLLNELVLIGAERDGPPEPMRRYVTRVTGWNQSQLQIAIELLSLDVYVFKGTNKPIPWTEKALGYCDAIRTARDAYKNGGRVYIHGNTRCKRVLPRGSTLLIPVFRRPRDRIHGRELAQRAQQIRALRDEAREHMIKLGIQSVDTLPKATSSSNPIIHHGIIYRPERTIILKTNRKTSIESLRNTVIVPSASELRAAIAAVRIYLTETRFAVTPSNQRDRTVLSKRRICGVQKLEDYLEPDILATYMGHKHSLRDIFSQWVTKHCKKLRSSTRIIFPVPSEARDILPLSLWTRYFRANRTVHVDFVFVDNNDDLPRALIYVACALQRLQGFTFSTRFVEALFKSIVTSNTTSALITKYHYGKPYRLKQWYPNSRWKHFPLYDTRYVVHRSVPSRRIRRRGTKDQYRYVYDTARAKLQFSRKILKDMRVAFKVLVLLLSSEPRVRKLLFATLSALKIEEYTPYLSDLTNITTGIEKLAAHA